MVPFPQFSLLLTEKFNSSLPPSWHYIQRLYQLLYNRHATVPATVFSGQVEIHLPISGLFNPLNAELNPICPLLALFGAHHILHVSR